MGTVISLKQLIQQWKTIVVCLSGTCRHDGAGIFRSAAYNRQDSGNSRSAAAHGGIVAATMMQDAAKAAGLEVAAVFAIAMYCVQGFAGYPITAVCLQKEGRRLSKICPEK